MTGVFALTTPDLALTRYVLEREQATGAPFRLEDLQVLHELHHESHLTTADAAALLQKTESQTRNALARMVEGGLVEVHGTGPTAPSPDPEPPSSARSAPPQATALLRRLVDRGDLVLIGERRGAHYIRHSCG